MSKSLILSANLCFHSLGMTMEVLGTLIGAALQGQIVASAHISPHCTVNLSVNTTDSWHDTPSVPDPSDPLSHQVSVYGNTLKYPTEKGGDVSLIPCHIQLDECEQDFLEIGAAGAETVTLLQTMLSIFAVFATPPQCDTRVSVRSFAGGAKPVKQLGGTWPPFVFTSG